MMSPAYALAINGSPVFFHMQIKNMECTSKEVETRWQWGNKRRKLRAYNLSYMQQIEGAPGRNQNIFRVHDQVLHSLELFLGNDLAYMTNRKNHESYVLRTFL